MAFARLAAALVVSVLLAACPKSPQEGLVPDGSGFPLDFVTPPVEGADPRVLNEVEAMGDSVYLNAQDVFVSFDKRRTWKQLNAPALGHISDFVFVTPTAGVARTGNHGLSYIELDKDVIYYLNDEPAWSAWGVRDGTVFTVRQVVDPGTIQVGDEKAQVWLGRRSNLADAAPWPEVKLPDLPFSDRTYLPSVHFGANGDIYVASYFGLQVSRDDGQTWQQVPVLKDVQGALSWSGVDLFVTRAGTLFARTQNTTFVSHDGGNTYVEAAYPGGITYRGSMMKMEEAVTGELYFRDLPYRSTDEGRTYQQLFTLERYAFEGLPETLYFRGGEYYFNVRFVSNFVSASPDTSLSILNPHQEGYLAPFNLTRAFPISGGRYLGLWNEGLITYTPGDLEWKVQRFFPNGYFLEQLRDGRFVLAEQEGLRFSRDEGVTWSTPVPVSKTSRNSVIVKALVEAPGRMFVSGDDRSHCDVRALLESVDDGASWQLVNVELILDPKQSPVNHSHYQVGLTTSDRSGVLHGYAEDLFNCLTQGYFPVSSESQARTWLGTTDRLPLDVTSRDNLLAIDDNGGPETVMRWDRASGKWESFGAPTVNATTVPNLFLLRPFTHVDAEDFVYFVDGHRVLKSTQPVH